MSGMLLMQKDTCLSNIKCRNNTTIFLLFTCGEKVAVEVNVTDVPTGSTTTVDLKDGPKTPQLVSRHKALSHLV